MTRTFDGAAPHDDAAWTLLRPTQPIPTPLPPGALLLADKPLGWTSFDVVGKLRYHLSRRAGVKRIKIGHAGTLDPLATGLLQICIGDYTKRIEALQASRKVYEGIMVLGATTPSCDREKPCDAFFPTDHLDDALLQKAAARFTGEIAQTPPVFSAVKVDGKRLFDLARANRPADIPERKVEIFELQLGPLRAIHPPRATSPDPLVLGAKAGAILQYPDYAAGLACDFRVVCSKGTYIRSLVRDIGAAAGSGAYLSALRRTQSGDFDVADAWDLDALTEALL